jgi:hypothetical protein
VVVNVVEKMERRIKFLCSAVNNHRYTQNLSQGIYIPDNPYIFKVVYWLVSTLKSGSIG